MEFWFYPGALVSVNALTKVTMTPAAPNEVPPAGATVIPQQPPLTQAVRAGAIADLEVVRQGMAAAQALSNQQTLEAQATLDAALTKSNEAAAQLAQAQQVQAGQPPPWEVTFREKR